MQLVENKYILVFDIIKGLLFTTPYSIKGLYLPTFRLSRWQYGQYESSVVKFVK